MEGRTLIYTTKASASHVTTIARSQMGMRTQTSNVSSDAKAGDDCSIHLLSKSTSLSSQPSLASLPSLHFHNQTNNQPLHQCLATLKAHSSYISAIAVHGNSIYSAGPDHEIRLWSIQSIDSPTSSTVVGVAKDPVKSLLVSGDDNLLSAHQDGKIRVWEINQRGSHGYRLKAVLPTPMDRLRSLLRPNKYVQVRRHVKCSPVCHLDAVSALALSHDGTLIYSVSWDRAIKVWRTADFRCTESIDGAHEDAINAVVVAPEGHVYTGSADGKIKVWRREGPGKHVFAQRLERHTSAVNALALSGDGAVLYSGAGDRAVVVWEGGGGRMAVAGALKGHRKAVMCVAVAAAGKVVCSGSADRTVRVWRREEWGREWYSCLAVLEGHEEPVKSLAVVAGEEREAVGGGGSCMVVSGGLDCVVKVWRISIPLPPSAN